MPDELNITLEDLAKAALGTDQLTHPNIAILYTLIEILLKKLNCKNETVSLNTFESKHLENITKANRTSPESLNDEYTEIVSAEVLQRLDKLQECVQRLDEKFDSYVKEEQRKSVFNVTNLSWETWQINDDAYLCTTCNPENEIACKLLKNTDFLKKLLRRLSAPTVERMFYFEKKIKELNNQFTIFVKRAEEEYQKVQLLEKCMAEIENLREIVQQQETQFLFTMEEIQDMLDTKLDKIHMPALKNYLRNNFKQINQSINILKEKEKRSRAAGTIIEGIRSVSCGNTKVCSDISVPPTSMLPDITLKSGKLPNHCVAARNFETSNKDAVMCSCPANAVKLTRPKAISNVLNVSTIPKCYKAGKDVELTEGFDSILYRKD